jgi:hypothetical protein
MHRSLLLISLGVVCSACSPATLHWSSSPSTNHPVVRVCGHTDLGHGLAFSEAGAGKAVGVLEVENVGSAPCAIRGVPRVTLRSAGGRSLAVRQTSESARGQWVVLRPGERADADFSWVNYCGTSGAAHATLAWRGISLRLRPAANGWMRRARCDDRSAGSTMSVGPFERRGG